MRVLYSQYANPAQYPPLEHSSRLLAQRGVEVLVLGVMPRDDTLIFAPHPGITIRTLPYAAPGWRQKLHYFWYSLWVFGWVMRWRPDWIYASDLLSTPAALLLSYLPALKVLYHEHDAPGKAESTFITTLLALRRRLLRRARLIVVPNAVRGEVLANESGTIQPILTVWNCPEIHDIQAVQPRTAQPLRLLYQGSIVPVRLPLTVLEAMAQVKTPVELHIIGYETIGHPDYISTLRQRAADLNMAGQVIVHGAIPLRRNMLTLTAQCDVGLALMPLQSDDLNERTMSGASNKPFDYLACGLALMVSQLPDWETLYVAPGYALACDPHDPQSLAAALQWYADHPAERQAMGLAGQRHVQREWNYETQFAPVLAQLLPERS